MTTRGVLAILAMASAASAFAVVRTNTIVSGTSDWTSKDNYTDKSFAPGAGDVVIIPAKATVYLNASTDSLSLALVNSLSKIWLTSDDSRVEITVTNNDVKVIETSMTAYSFAGKTVPGYLDYTGGPIVKKGTGTLILASQGAVPYSQSEYNFDYYSSIIVESGTLKINPEMTSPCYKSYLGRVKVAAGAVLFTPFSTFHHGTIYCQGLSGAGTVTNTITPGYISDIVFQASAVSYYTNDFSGQINGTYNGLYFDNNGQILSGTNSYAQLGNGGVHLYGGAYPSFGGLHVSSQSPSGLGYGTKDIYLNYSVDAGSGFKLVGDGGASFTQGFIFESTDKTDYRRAAIIDSGSKGGYTFNGLWQRRYSSSGGRSLVLRGESADPCVIAGDVNDNHNTTDYRGRGHTMYISKEGSGTWRFARYIDNKGVVKERANFASGFSVNEGVLEYETIALAGVACSIGVATNLTDGQWGAADTNIEHRVDYAIRLGAPLLDGTTKTSGRFSYVGETPAGNLDRKIALAGAGGIRSNASSGGIVHGEVYGISDQPMSLYLDGDNATDDNVVNKVSDGTAGGKVTVVKEGTGKWHIGPTSDFSGAIDVRGGELVLDAAKYMWYRWTINSLYPLKAPPLYDSWAAANSSNKELTFYEFALYDKDGYNQVEHYQTNTKIKSAAAVPLMAPGTAEVLAYGGNRVESLTQEVGGVEYDMAVRKAFDLATSTGEGVWGVKYYLYDKDNNRIRIDGDNPDTRMSVVIRLKPDAHDIVSYDYMNTYGGYSPAWGMSISNSCLEASVDGVNWEHLYTTNALPHHDGGMWTFQGGYTDGENTHTTKYPDSHTLTSPRTISRCPRISSTPSVSASYAAHSVRISGGGKLTVAGGASDLMVSSLEVDAQTGGTIDGVTLASNLSLSLTNVPKVVSMEIPVTFTNVVWPSDASGWMVKYNGKETGSWLLEVRDGKLSILKKGALIIVR